MDVKQQWGIGCCTGTTDAAIAPKRPAVISAVVTPAAPAHMRAKRAVSSGGNAAGTDAKQQQQPQQQQHEHPPRTLAVPVSAVPGTGRPSKASEKPNTVAASSQLEHQPHRSEARKPEQLNSSGAPSKQNSGYLQAAKGQQAAAAPEDSLGEYPELNGGSKDRVKEAPAKEHKAGLGMPPGLQRAANAAERQNSAKEANGGSDRSAPVDGACARKDRDKNRSNAEAAGDGKGPAQQSAPQPNGGGADKEKLRKKRNTKKVKGGTGAGIVGAP